MWLLTVAKHNETVYVIGLVYVTSPCSESVNMLSNHFHCAPKVKRRQIANLIKREKKFVAVVEHSLST